jgi:putative oxidoreductase
MAGYCGITALLWKQFWKPGDFWSVGSSRARDLFWDFLKNLSLAGGFLLITFGTDVGQVAALLSHPQVSSHPYSARQVVH